MSLDRGVLTVCTAAMPGVVRIKGGGVRGRDEMTKNPCLRHGNFLIGPLYICLTLKLMQQPSG